MTIRMLVITAVSACWNEFEQAHPALAAELKPVDYVRASMAEVRNDAACRKALPLTLAEERAATLTGTVSRIVRGVMRLPT